MTFWEAFIPKKSEESVEEKKATRRRKSELPRTPEEEVLSSRERVSSSRLEGGDNVNEVEFVALHDDGKGVFKSRVGEATYERGPELFKRERAAYLVSRFLDLDLVPPTVVRELEGKLGSLQRFISDADIAEVVAEEKWVGAEDEFVKLFIFDYIIGNRDRHVGNFLFKDGRIYAIDHGNAFDRDYITWNVGWTDEGEIKQQYKHRLDIGPESFGAYDAMWRAMHKEIPIDLVEKIEKFSAWSEGQEILRDLILELLPQETAEACMARLVLMCDIVRSGKRIDDVKNRLVYHPKA